MNMSDRGKSTVSLVSVCVNPPSPCHAMVIRRKARKATEMPIAKKPKKRKRRSALYRLAMRFCIPSPVQREAAADALFICFSIFAHHAERDEIEDQGDHEEQQSEREGGQRLGAVEFLIARQKLDDLGR